MLSYASTSGPPNNGVYSQTIISGNFYIILKIVGDAEKVTIELGRNFVSKIEEVISQTPEIAPNELVEIVESERGSDLSISLIVAFIPNQKLIAAMIGEVAIKIVRDGKLINLNQSTVSGNLLQGDLITLGSVSFYNKINIIDLVNQSNKTADEIKEFLIPQIEQNGDGPDVVGLILKLNLEENKLEENSQEQKLESENILPNTVAAAEISQPGQSEPMEESVPEEQPANPTAEPPAWGKKSKLPAFFGGLSKLVPTKQNILYLKQAREKGFETAPPKKTLYLVVVAFVILLSVIAFQLRSRSLEVQNQNLNKIEKEASEGINASSKLIGLNDQLAREALTQKREEIITEIEKDFGSEWKSLKTKEGDRLRAVVAKIDNEIARAANINNVKLTDFFDFSILKDDPNISSAQLHEGTIVVLDSANGSVYSLKTENKSGTIVGGGNFDSKSYVDFNGDELYVYDSPNIRQKNMLSNAAFRNVAKDATNSGDIKTLASFAGNLYLLDPSSSEIWKYQGNEEGTFSSTPTPYVQPGLNLDLSEAKGMTIDGFIYVFDGNTIRKFSSGAPEQLELKKLATPIESIDSVFSSEDSKNIYIWDGTNNKVVVVNKEGLYQAQYQLPSLPNSSKAIVLADEKQKKIFLVLGSKVYGIDIQ